MYNYQDHKLKIFTDEGQRDFLKVRDHVHKMLKDSGAFMMIKAFKESHAGTDWEMQANVDRLVELKEIREVLGDFAGQHRVFVSYKY